MYDVHSVQILVLDEADLLFDKDRPHSYADNVELIINKCTNPKIQRALFSATLDSHVMDLTESFLNMPLQVSIGNGMTNCAENVQQQLVYCGDERAHILLYPFFFFKKKKKKKRGKLIAILKEFEIGLKPPVLIFVQSSKRGVELQIALQKHLPQVIVGVIADHMTTQEKNTAVARFRAGELWFLICTDVLARGMDFLNVETVINYDFPQCTTDYIHRVGRTGRADRVGRALTLWCDVDKPLLRGVVEVIIQANQGHNLPQWMKKLKHFKKLSQTEVSVAKKEKTDRGPIRRGGDYVHGKSAIKNKNIQKGKVQKKKSVPPKNTKKFDSFTQKI
ncbi:hypothetical protein RFI_06488 [Reticulomyxa filosa]|uniref:RNA helicase n=1 Tax=Reticulomyxa filosa TaxID=46433 RepID=X6NZC2_RETFI|nr:hypothetical protein RFI_06488 [Reticulomyxa filosa]|eukprot:ETO30632.1 hypothetical protein RFI_06488 [Reticulomyxa filosa]